MSSCGSTRGRTSAGLEHRLIGVPSNATAASAGPKVRRTAGCSIGQCAQEREVQYLSGDIRAGLWVAAHARDISHHCTPAHHHVGSSTTIHFSHLHPCGEQQADATRPPTKQHRLAPTENARLSHSSNSAS